MTDIVEMLRCTAPIERNYIVHLAAKEIERLRAERDAAAKDAERYRCLRTQARYVSCGDWDFGIVTAPDATSVDAAIDAARGEK